MVGSHLLYSGVSLGLLLILPVGLLAILLWVVLIGSSRFYFLIWVNEKSVCMELRLLLFRDSFNRRNDFFGRQMFDKKFD